MNDDEPNRIITPEELESLAPLPSEGLHLIESPSPMPKFEDWPKIPRLFKDMVITEKIDGTNAQIFITPGGVRAGSRKRWLTPEDDNYGFCRWAGEHAGDLHRLLGEGRHFGEWWGQGIQRRYDMEHKVFSLFNTGKWDGLFELDGQLRAVPVLDVWTFDTDRIELAAVDLKEFGSQASPGFMRPEGICVFHTGANQIFKIPFEAKLSKGGPGCDDSMPKKELSTTAGSLDDWKRPSGLGGY